MALSARDIDAVVRTLYGEARGEGDKGLEAVAWVLRNRLSKRHRGAKTLYDVATAHSKSGVYQFDGYKRARTTKIPTKFRQRATRIIEDVMKGTHDPTGGADHFISGTKTPKWFSRLERQTGQKLKIGGHRFTGGRGKTLPKRSGKVNWGKVDPKQLNGITRRRVAHMASLVDHPIEIISGHRTEEHNKKVGGAKHSHHVRRNAVDVSLKGLSDDQRTKLVKAARAAGFGGIGAYSGNTSIHLDNRERGDKGAHFMFDRTSRNMGKAHKWFIAGTQGPVDEQEIFGSSDNDTMTGSAGGDTLAAPPKNYGKGKKHTMAMEAKYAGGTAIPDSTHKATAKPTEPAEPSSDDLSGGDQPAPVVPRKKPEAATATKQGDTGSAINAIAPGAGTIYDVATKGTELVTAAGDKLKAMMGKGTELSGGGSDDGLKGGQGDDTLAADYSNAGMRGFEILDDPEPKIERPIVDTAPPETKPAIEFGTQEKPRVVDAGGYPTGNLERQPDRINEDIEPHVGEQPGEYYIPPAERKPVTFEPAKVSAMGEPPTPPSSPDFNIAPHVGPQPGEYYVPPAPNPDFNIAPHQGMDPAEYGGVGIPDSSATEVPAATVPRAKPENVPDTPPGPAPTPDTPVKGIDPKGLPHTTAADWKRANELQTALGYDQADDRFVTPGGGGWQYLDQRDPTGLGQTGEVDSGPDGQNMRMLPVEMGSMPGVDMTPPPAAAADNTVIRPDGAVFQGGGFSGFFNAIFGG